MRPLKSVDVQRIRSFPQVVQQLRQQLAELRDIAENTNFDDPEHKDQFVRNLEYLKQYYERGERLVLDAKSKEDRAEHHRRDSEPAQLHDVHSFPKVRIP